MKTISLTVDGKKITVTKGKTVLEAALDSGIYIPNLCYHPDLSPWGGCRLCLVHIEGLRGLPTACTTIAEDGMIVKTTSPEIKRIRQVTAELLIANHSADCLSCEENLQCELQSIAAYVGVNEQRFKQNENPSPKDVRNPLFVHDRNKCILCGRCVRICKDVRGVDAISFLNRGQETQIGSAFNRPLGDAGCRFCGACVEVCPTGAISDREPKWESYSERKQALIPCINACPAEVDIPRYVRLISEGKYSDAVLVIAEKAPFPRILGRVCTHPCEDVCRREQLNEPISIKNLKRFAADVDKGLWAKKITPLPDTQRNVAVIGAGPAGLTAAFFLKKFGHSVTVYDIYPKLGGMLRWGIPEFRLPREILDAEINDILSIGLKVKTNTHITTLDPLFHQGFHAILVATGAWKNLRLGIEGEDSPNVLDCISFLRDVNLGKKVSLGRSVAVIGGGNAAVDAARTAIRLRSQVTLVYRRTRNEMPACSEEVDEAIKEGVKFLCLATPKKISTEDGKLILECYRMRLGEPDATGRRVPFRIKNSEFTSTFDSIIIAVGQSTVVPTGFELELDSYGRVKVDSTLQTNRNGVFACGDFIKGPSTVIEAIASGRTAALEIDKSLGGKGILAPPLVTSTTVSQSLKRIENFAKLPRQNQKNIPKEGRLTNFNEVEQGLNKKQALDEAKRCCLCNLRFNISTIEPPPIQKIKKKDT